jgi:hypothetical protein
MTPCGGMADDRSVVFQLTSGLPVIHPESHLRAACWRYRLAALLASCCGGAAWSGYESTPSFFATGGNFSLHIAYVD